jgi:hypothetical protein
MANKYDRIYYQSDDSFGVPEERHVAGAGQLKRFSELDRPL